MVCYLLVSVLEASELVTTSIHRAIVVMRHCALSIEFPEELMICGVQLDRRQAIIRISTFPYDMRIPDIYVLLWVYGNIVKTMCGMYVLCGYSPCDIGRSIV